MKDIILQGDSLEILKTLPDESVDCIVTSPPYWALRDYGTDGMIWDGNKRCKHQWKEHVKKPTGGKGSKSANVGANRNDTANIRDHDIISNFCNKCDAWKGNLGLEPTPQLYIQHLCTIFDEVKRVLKKEGTCWVNLGDTYSGNKVGKTDNKVSEYLKSTTKNLNKKASSVPEKSLCQIPSRFAIAMTDRGWILRNEIIWHKPNCMPSSVRDRFTVDFEKVFFFVKNKKYYFDMQKVPTKTKDNSNRNRDITKLNNTPGRSRMNGLKTNNYDFRNPRAVWTITTKPYKEAHFATFPEALIEPMIKAGCPVGGIVLDPFFGAGTTGIVAKKQDKYFLGIELNQDYIDIATRRVNGLPPKLFTGLKQDGTGNPTYTGFNKRWKERNLTKE